MKVSIWIATPHGACQSSIVTLKKLALFAAWNFFTAGVMLAGIEIGLALLLAHPVRQPALLRGLRSFYMNTERAIPQYLPDCARFDAELGYTMRPGHCRFTNREFSVAIAVNSKGMRDDEAALMQPEIIVAGDSYSMGWGVEHEQTFAEIVKQRSGKRLLNAGVSSYGTARELEILKRVDTSHLQWLVIQFSANDKQENTAFLNPDVPFHTMDAAAYSALVSQVATQRYYPGRYLRRLLPQIVHELRAGAPEMPSLEDRKANAKDSAHLFLEVLRRARHLPNGVRVLVFALEPWNNNDSLFADAVQQDLQERGNAAFAAEVIPLDVSPDLHDDMYYVLDDHMNSLGHAAVADRICTVIGC